jgi:hypothetical protein
MDVYKLLFVLYEFETWSLILMKEHKFKQVAEENIST